MTRDNDTFVLLTERTNIANQYEGRDAIFVLIHYNSHYGRARSELKRTATQACFPFGGLGSSKSHPSNG